MDRDRALKAFLGYVAAYDADNPRIALKVEHTLRVTELCDRIARELGLPDEDVDAAWLVGLLHDIGRFEQVRRWDTFNDAASGSHAALGVEVLLGPQPGSTAPLMRAFVDDPADDGLVLAAVGTHSDYRLPEELDGRVRTICQILRDADKIDILRVNCTCPIEAIYGVSEADMRASAVSDECVHIFYQHRCLPRGIRRHNADIMLGHICFAWEIVYPQSLAIMREQAHLARMLSRSWDLPDTQRAFDLMRVHMHEELGI